MATIVSMDKAGRVLLPKSARKQMHLQPGSKFIVTEMEDGRLVFIPLDVEHLTKRFREEFKGVDFDAEISRVKKELRVLAEERYPEIAARLKKRR